jgi:hypothetical protein
LKELSTPLHQVLSTIIKDTDGPIVNVFFTPLMGSMPVLQYWLRRLELFTVLKCKNYSNLV